MLLVACSKDVATIARELGLLPAEDRLVSEGVP